MTDPHAAVRAEIAARLDDVIDAAAEAADGARALPLPTDRAGVSALKGAVAAGIAHVEALLKLREYAAVAPAGTAAADTADPDGPMTAEEAEDLIAGARRTLARTRPKAPAKTAAGGRAGGSATGRR